MFDWDDLRILLAVSRTASVSGAARHLGVDPSTVSRRIRHLEEAAGATLLLRTPQGVGLTEAAAELAAHAEGMEALAAQAERGALGRTFHASGIVRLVAPEELASTLLPSILAAFLTRFPGVELRWADEAEAGLGLWEADVRLCITATPLRETRAAERIASLARADYASARLLQRAEGASLPRVTCAHDAATLSPSPPEPGSGAPSVHRVGSPALLLSAARGGIGVATLPCFVGDRARDLRRVTPPRLEGVPELWLLAGPQGRAHPHVRAFLDFVGSALRRERELFEGRAGR